MGEEDGRWRTGRERSVGGSAGAGKGMGCGGEIEEDFSRGVERYHGIYQSRVIIQRAC